MTEEPLWVTVDEVTPELATRAEIGLREINKLVDHLVSAVREHKEDHNLCLTFCPGSHFIADIEEWSWPDNELNTSDWAIEMTKCIHDLHGIITVMATRLAGYDTD